MTELAHDLTVLAREAVAGTKRDLLEAALDVARAERMERGRAIVHLAGALRDHDKHDEALAFLDLVDSRYEDPKLIRAAFTCAIAIHVDLDATTVANTLCNEQRDRAPVDLYFLRAEVRARKAWLDKTGEEAAFNALQRAQAELEKSGVLSVASPA